MWKAIIPNGGRCLTNGCNAPATHAVTEDTEYELRPIITRCEFHAEERAAHLNRRDAILVAADAK